VALFNWGRKTVSTPSSAPASPVDSGLVSTSKVLPKLLAALRHVPSPVLVDLGPVIGSNIAFLGEQLSCRIIVENLFDIVEEHARANTRQELAASLTSRLRQEPGSADGILCWDLFDYLDKTAAPALASHLVRILRPGGLLYCFFGASPGDITVYTRYSIENASTFRLRTTPATKTVRRALVPRDINKLFEGLATIESVMLKTHTREILFRRHS
jgi:hypothetical protein